MQETTISLILSVLALLVAIVAFFQSNKPAPPPSADVRPAPVPVAATTDTLPLQLQAYERLVLLTERIALPNLVSRLNQPDFSAREMQVLLLESIKQEFEYNSSQQIYVSDVAWEAVRNLKDQNMLLINQIASILPPDARSTDLNRQLVEVVMNQRDAALHSIVLNALNFEAKKILHRS
ncbi:hypothetical protein V9K67_13735 [Paraflavisolibacter sp. H34]|uniref:DUF7935 family protein n=1 Tax=Huijunlia imazamoxiresistens TaxID=3127457 RepID=UPI003019E746